jgi:hypothetical protein
VVGRVDLAFDYEDELAGDVDLAVDGEEEVAGATKIWPARVQSR